MRIEISKQMTSLEADTLFGTPELWLDKLSYEMIRQISKARDEAGRPSGMFTITVQFEIAESVHQPWPDPKKPQ